MSTKNENILKSLAVLEQNLQDINTAKEQVQNVVDGSRQLTSIVNTYKESLEGISSNVTEILNTSKQLNLETRENLLQQVNRFQNEISRLENIDLESEFATILTAITNHLDVQNIEISKKFEEVINKSESITLRIDKQDKEAKTLKSMVFVTIGIIIIGIVIILVMK